MRAAKYTRDWRNLTIFEGTNEVSKLYITLSGLQGPGMCSGEMQAAVDITLSNPIKGFGVPTDYAEALERGDGVGRCKKYYRPGRNF